jgi:tetratricopeptide (TPR) repeat protein
LLGISYLHRPPALTDKDTIILADFDNSTGDPVFDGTLRQGLAVQLEQSPFLSLISDQRVRQALRLMGQSPDARLTPELARDLCQRTASAAVLDGSIASLGSEYVLGLRATNCRTGDILAEEQVRATGKEQVLTALDTAAVKLREKLGESAKSLQAFDTPLEQATTPSLEALQAYSLGRQMFFTKGQAAAVPFLKRAIELDPNFAMAYRALASNGSLGQPNLVAAYATKGLRTARQGERARALFHRGYLLLGPLPAIWRKHCRCTRFGNKLTRATTRFTCTWQKSTALSVTWKNRWTTRASVCVSSRIVRITTRI